MPAGPPPTTMTFLRREAGEQGAEAQLAPAHRILDAGDRISLVEVSDAGLIAGDAGADIFGRAAGRLVRHLRIADQRARHAADIGMMARDHRLGLLRLIDAPGHEYRDLRLALEAGGVGHDVGGIQCHRRRDVNGAAQTGGGAERDVRIVDAVAQAGHGLESLILGQSLFVDFRCRYPQSHHEAVGYLGADIGDHLAQEAQAAVEIAAVGIVAQIDAGVQKLRRQIAVAGDDFHTVQSGSLHAAGGVAVAVNDGVDHGFFQWARHDVKAFVRNRGRGVRHAEQAAVRLGNFTARMEQLPEQHGAETMHRLCDAAVAGNRSIVRRHQHMIGVTRGFVDSRHLQHDQAHAAAGSRFLICHQRRIDRSVHGQRGVVTARHDAVLQGTAADTQRLEEMSECRHGCIVI